MSLWKPTFGRSTRRKISRNSSLVKES